MLLESRVTRDAEFSLAPLAPAPSDWIDDLLKEAFEKTQNPPDLRLANLLYELADAITRYLYFPQPEVAMLIACWIASTYTFRTFTHCGYLAIHSKSPGSGKTRLLDLLSLLTKGHPPIYTNPTPAVLFRSNQEVVLIDEVDRLRGQDKQTYGVVLSILNAGFAANGVVPRTERVDEKGKFETVQYPVYGPKAFAGLEKLDPSLASRCFHIEMTQAPQRLPRFGLRIFGDTGARLRKELEAWVCSNQVQIDGAFAALPTELESLRCYDDRYQDIAEPLLVLAMLADAEEGGAPRITPLLLDGLRVASCERVPTEGERLKVLMFEVLSPVLGEQSTRFIPSKELLSLVQARGLSWIDSTKDLATVLAKCGLSPRSNGTVHGYEITKDSLMALKPIRQGPTPL